MFLFLQGCFENQYDEIVKEDGDEEGDEFLAKSTKRRDARCIEVRFLAVCESGDRLTPASLLG